MYIHTEEVQDGRIWLQWSVSSNTIVMWSVWRRVVPGDRRHTAEEPNLRKDWSTVVVFVRTKCVRLFFIVRSAEMQNDKYWPDFRFLWPCIVNVGEEGTNGWHKLRCLFACGNKMPTRCNRGFYCRSYCLLNIFRASLCPSSAAQEYYTVVAACGILCCGFSSSWSGVELRVMCLVCRMLRNHCIILLSSWWWA